MCERQIFDPKKVNSKQIKEQFKYRVEYRNMIIEMVLFIIFTQLLQYTVYQINTNKQELINHSEIDATR